jgi:hypothetical protein
VMLLFGVFFKLRRSKVLDLLLVNCSKLDPSNKKFVGVLSRSSSAWLT